MPGMIGFSAYLWGIETMIFGISSRWNTVFSVPMRNWNRHPWRLLQRRPKRFSAYLWGIETSQAGASHSHSPGFQRTYEELKLSEVLITLLPKPRFQRTYEELKRWSSVYHPRWNTVFSVPMRNWNRHPWRLLQRRPKRFSAYLWGIETSQAGASHSHSPGFQRTYEELKHDDDYILQLDPAGFQRTYEELKPEYFASFIGNGVVFSVPMRNWNALTYQQQQ